MTSLRTMDRMMIAAHPHDLRVARENGIRTAYLPRPLEFGPGGQPEPRDPSFDLVASDLIGLDRELAG
jgi:2-haloacid dehalogenase